jgi:hypothetical protein
MNMKREEALSLLHSWNEDRRLIQGFLILSERTHCCVVGMIERLDGNSIRVAPGRTGKHIGLSLDLAAAISFEYEDTRFIDSIPALSIEQIQKTYDGFLFMQFPTFRAQLWACRTIGELSSSPEVA